MLPGFRFLCAAIVLTMSILIFGLGAAALLRTAHEEFASKPSWHAAPETTFAQQGEATRPALAMLRVDTPVVEKPSDDLPAAAAPAASAEQPAIASIPVESERIAALMPEDSPPPAPAPPEIQVAEIQVAETPAQDEAAPAPVNAPASAAETKIAAVEQAPPANQAAPAVSEQTSAAALLDTSVAATKIATLGGPSVVIEARPPDKAIAKSEASVIQKRLQARRAAQRRKIAVARARLGRQALPQQQQQQQQSANPFAQPALR